jgi:hypothetical protein
MEDGAGAQPDLMAAGAALDELAGLDLAAAPATAARPDKALRPTPGEERRPALLFASMGCTELPLTEAFLELDLVARPGEPLGKARMFTFCTRSTQLRIVRKQEVFSS